MEYPFIKPFLKEKYHIFFISPHLDDAILSCGALIAELSRIKPENLHIINIFTKGSKIVTDSNNNYILACGANNQSELFRMKKTEEITLARETHVSSVNLDYIDVGWRNNNYKIEIDKIYANILKIIKLSILNNHFFVFLPIGVGRNPDHLIVRNIGNYFLPKEVVYYSDYPYNIKYVLPKKFIKERHLKEYAWSQCLEKKSRLICFYKSQLKHLFPRGNIPLLREKTFYFR